MARRKLHKFENRFVGLNRSAGLRIESDMTKEVVGVHKMRIHRTSAIKAIYGGNRNEKKGVPTVKAIPAFSMATVKPHAGGRNCRIYYSNSDSIAKDFSRK